MALASTSRVRTDAADPPPALPAVLKAAVGVRLQEALLLVGCRTVAPAALRRVGRSNGSNRASKGRSIIFHR
ncbi:MAG: hypothetical protein ABW003_28170 [Microvirga sp.]